MHASKRRLRKSFNKRRGLGQGLPKPLQLRCAPGWVGTCVVVVVAVVVVVEVVEVLEVEEVEV